MQTETGALRADGTAQPWPKWQAESGRAGKRILLVQDRSATHRSITTHLKQRGLRVTSTQNALEAVTRLESESFDLLIVDVSLPGSSGLGLLLEVRSRWPGLPVIMMSRPPEPVSVVRAINGGADRYLVKPFSVDELGRWVDDELGLGAADSGRGGETVAAAVGPELPSPVLRAVRSLVQAVEAKDPYTRGHSLRVSLYGVILAEQMGGFDLDRMRLGGELHDIGKIGVPDSVLNKPGRLDPIEFDKIKRHPVIGRRILEPLIDDEQVLDMTLYHHERWDGQGYPKGLKGEAIPLVARVLAVADALDAITSSRAYRPAGTWEYAVNRIQSQCGTQFAPEMAEVFAATLPRLRGRFEELRGQKLAVG